MPLTKNHAALKAQVEAHVAADELVQGEYWREGRGCFIGCLSHSNNPLIAVKTFGLTEPILRIAESIFEALPKAEATAFFAALPDAVACDGKDLSRVHWQFLAAELRALPKQPKNIQAVIDPVSAGMDLLAAGKPWPDAAGATYAAASAAAYAADAAAYAADAAADAVASAAAGAAADAGAVASAAAGAAAYAARIRQRDTLLRLITEAPVDYDTRYGSRIWPQTTKL